MTLTPELLNRSRMVVTEMMTSRGFDMTQHTNFTPVLNIKSSFDTITVKKEDEITVIRYDANRRTTHKSLMDIVEDEIEHWDERNKLFTIVLVVSEEPSVALKDAAKLIYQTKRVFVQPFSIERLSFNISKHSIVPLHERLQEDNLEEIKKIFFETFHINTYEKLPKIFVDDPVAMFIGLRPRELCKITRNTINAGDHVVYRYCTYQ